MWSSYRARRFFAMTLLPGSRATENSLHVSGGARVPRPPLPHGDRSNLEVAAQGEERGDGTEQHAEDDRHTNDVQQCPGAKSHVELEPSFDLRQKRASGRHDDPGG